MVPPADIQRRIRGARRAGVEPEFIRALRQPAAYPHAVKTVRLVQTHILGAADR